MTTLLIILLVVALIAAFWGGPRWYRGRRTVVREYDY